MRLLKWAEIRAVLDEAEIRLSTRGLVLHRWTAATAVYTAGMVAGMGIHEEVGDE